MTAVFILVLYNLTLKNSTSFSSISQSLKRAREKGFIFIFDNSKNRQLIENLDNNIWSGYHYYNCPNNKGVSYAYNKGVEYAKKNHAKWVVLLDQDTDFEKNFIQVLTGAIERNPNINLFAPKLILSNNVAFSPVIYKHKRGIAVDVKKEGIYSLYQYVPVNSGMVINVDSFLEVGGYNEDVRLDFSDFQFIERFREKNKSFYLLATIGLQSFSNDEIDINKLKTRFKIYCECAKNCKKMTLLDRVDYFYSVFRHTIGLIIKTKKLVFIKSFIDYYMR